MRVSHPEPVEELQCLVVLDVLGDRFAACEGGHFRDGGDDLLIRVSDSGSGMSDEVRAHLFEPFFTTKEVGKGTGLGLATAYALVRDVGGLLQCERTGASGTVFAIYLPADPSDRRGEATAPGPLVLVVEHDDAVRRSIARVLSSSGFQVLEAATGSAAQSLWRQHPGVALVLLEQSPQVRHRDMLAALRRLGQDLGDNARFARSRPAGDQGDIGSADRPGHGLPLGGIESRVHERHIYLPNRIKSAFAASEQLVQVIPAADLIDACLAVVRRRQLMGVKEALAAGETE